MIDTISSRLQRGCPTPHAAQDLCASRLDLLRCCARWMEPLHLLHRLRVLYALPALISGTDLRFAPSFGQSQSNLRHIVFLIRRPYRYTRRVHRCRRPLLRPSSRFDLFRLDLQIILGLLSRHGRRTRSQKLSQGAVGVLISALVTHCTSAPRSDSPSCSALGVTHRYLSRPGPSATPSGRSSHTPRKPYQASTVSRHSSPALRPAAYFFRA